MDCNVIIDLLPLHADKCCSEQSSRLVEEHIQSCPACKRVYHAMTAPAEVKFEAPPPMKMRRISDWKASLLQSVMLYVSFGLIALGVMLEAATPYGISNGLWAYALVIPATANLFSLSNWFFMRLYKNRKVFSNCSCLMTLLLAAGGYLWALIHYQFAVYFSPLVIVGIVLSLFFVVMSKILSNRYAQWLGRE